MCTIFVDYSRKFNGFAEYSVGHLLWLLLIEQVRRQDDLVQISALISSVYRDTSTPRLIPA